MVAGVDADGGHNVAVKAMWADAGLLVGAGLEGIAGADAVGIVELTVVVTGNELTWRGSRISIGKSEGVKIRWDGDPEGIHV